MLRFRETFGISCRLMLLAATFASVSARAAPGDVLFNDNFERAALAPWTTTNAGVSGILTGGAVSNSPTRGAFTSNIAVIVTSPTINAAVPSAQVSLWIRRGSDVFSEDTDAGEDFILEYRRANNTWSALATYLGGGVNGEIIQPTFQLPPDALHANFALRLRQTGGSGFSFDFWHFDDVTVTEVAPPPPFGVGGCDDFESGLAGNWTINATSGFAGTSTATSQSPTNALFTNGGVIAVTSNTIDTSNPAFSNMTMWIRRGADAFSEDPDVGENLVVEYLDNLGVWIALETFNGAGGQGQIFARSYFLPPAGRHAAMQVRFRQTGGNGAPWDFWHVDDVCFDVQLLPNLLVTKVSQTISDPLHGTTNPFSIPGAIKEYSLTVANDGPAGVDAGSTIITDVVPTNTALFVDTSGGDPVVFIDGPVASGLSFNFATDVTFSNQSGGGAPFTYAPTPDVNGFDLAVTGFRVAPSGAMNAAGFSGNPSYSLTFRIQLQ